MSPCRARLHHLLEDSNSTKVTWCFPARPGAKIVIDYFNIFGPQSSDWNCNLAGNFLQINDMNTHLYSHHQQSSYHQLSSVHCWESFQLSNEGLLTLYTVTVNTQYSIPTITVTPWVTVCST